MKKKILSFIFAIFLIIPCVLALTACGKKPPAEDEKNEEFTKFSTQVVSIMSAVDMSASNGNTEPVALSSRNLSLKNDKTLKLMSASMPANDIDTIFNLVKEHDESNIVENVNEEYAFCLEDCFTAPLGMGDVITNKQGAKNFYDVKVRIDYGSGIYGSCVVTNSGNKTEIYLFDASTGSGTERYAYLKLIYNNKTDYNFERIDYTQSLNNFIYYYGDSKQNFISLTKYTDEYSGLGYNAYVSNGMSCYSVGGVSGEEVQTYIDTLITNKNPHQYNNQINATKTDTSYTVSLNDVVEATEKYIEKSNEEDETYPIFVNKFGVVESLGVGDDFDCPTVVIPSKATALSGDLTLNPNCTKIIIPDSVTSIKMPTDETATSYVDAPIQSVLEGFHISAGYNGEDTQTPVEIVFSENNKLFKTGEDGNVYLTYGDGEYLFYINNWETEALETLGGMNETAQNDFRQVSSRGIPNWTFNAYKQLKQSDHKFKNIIFSDNIYKEILTAENYTDTSEYVIDTVTCYGGFSVSDFYRTDIAEGGSSYGYEENIRIPNTQKVTRIKELIIKPREFYNYRYNEDLSVPAPDWNELKNYIDQNYQGQSYDDVLDNIIPKIKEIDASQATICLNNFIQIDKITVDSSFEMIWLYGYFGEDTILDIPSSVEVLYGEVAEIYSTVTVCIDDIEQIVDFEERISPFKGKINFTTNFTQSEFNYLLENTTDYNGDLTREYIKEFVENSNSKCTLTYAEENINLLGLANLTQYFDFSQFNEYGFKYTTYYYNNAGDNGYYQDCQLYLNNMIDEIDLTNYITCGTNWEYKVYIQTYEEVSEQNIWLENTNGKVLKNLMHNGILPKTINCKFVGTNTQNNQTTEKFLTINVLGQKTWGTYTYETEYFTQLSQYTSDTVVEVKDSLGNIITVHSNLPLEYGLNIFTLKCQYDNGVSYYQVQITRNYNTINVDNSTNQISIYDYNFYYSNLENMGFEIKVYDIEGNEILDKAHISLSVGDNVLKIVSTWKGEGEISGDDASYDGKVEIINYYRASE